jgi:hypothetical protein
MEANTHSAQYGYQAPKASFWDKVKAEIKKIEKKL